MKIYFTRHGETIWNNEKKIQGRSDIPLNDYGRELAHITAAALKDIPFDVVYSSPLIRAKETARILVQDRNLTIYENELLAEMSFGAEEGTSLPKIHAHPEYHLYNFIHNPDAYIPSAGGETFQELYDRCTAFMEKVILPAETKYKHMLIVGHGALIRGMIHYINQRPTKDFWSVDHRNCSVTTADLSEGRLTLLDEAKTYYDL